MAWCVNACIIFGFLISVTLADSTSVVSLKSQKPSVSRPIDSKLLKHLDSKLLKATFNITKNPEIGEALQRISNNLVSSILSKLEAQDEIARITNEALESAKKNEGMIAIEIRRMLDFISKTITAHILTITKEKAKPELKRLVYGLAQTAGELSIISTLNEVSYATAISRKNSIDLSTKRRRSINEHTVVVRDTSLNEGKTDLSTFDIVHDGVLGNMHVMSSQTINTGKQKEFKEHKDGISADQSIVDNSDAYILQNQFDKSLEKAPKRDITVNEFAIADEISEPKDTTSKGSEDSNKPELKTSNPDNTLSKPLMQKTEKLEARAKKAILFAGEASFLAASSVISLRKTLAAYLEVQHAVKYAKTASQNHKELMIKLARTAAQQAGREARNAISKSVDCEHIIRLAVKFSTESAGANLTQIANRIIMDGLAQETIAKSMAYVATDVAMNSMYIANGL